VEGLMFQLFFESLSLGEVSGDYGGSYDVALCVLDRRYGNGSVDPSAVLLYLYGICCSKALSLLYILYCLR
jgi:hypothetical protein